MDTLQKPNKKPRINYALAATLIASGATLAQAAARSGAANALTLKTCLRRKGLTFSAIRNAEPNLDNIQRVAIRAVSQASEALREQFSDILATHGAALAKVPAKGDLKHLKRVGEAMEPLARIGKIVHDWGNNTVSGLVMVGGMPDLEHDTPAIEVQGAVEVVEQIPQPVVGQLPDSALPK